MPTFLFITRRATRVSWHSTAPFQTRMYPLGSAWRDITTAPIPKVVTPLLTAAQPLARQAKFK
jgi:hypothetical protein